MRQIDSQKFGAFVAALRREKGMTQKQLAEAVCVTDKAVSKWERGLSLPDIAVLSPLAETLGVTVTELLRGERQPAAQPLPLAEVDRLVTDTLTLGQKNGWVDKERRGRELRAMLMCAFAGTAFIFLAAALLQLGDALWQRHIVILLLEGITAVSGVSVCFLEDTLPRYYDENVLHYYANGVLRLHIFFIRFSNRNWRQIKAALLATFRCMLLLAPVLYFAFAAFFPALWEVCAPWIALPYCTALFGPMLYVGVKYQ